MHLQEGQVDILWNPMGLWDGTNNRTHIHPQEGQVDIPWNVPWD